MKSDLFDDASDEEYTPPVKANVEPEKDFN